MLRLLTAAFSDAGPASTTGGATRTEARAGDPKTAKGGNRDGWAGRRLGRYGDLSGVAGRQQRRERRFKRLAGTGDAQASNRA